IPKDARNRRVNVRDLGCELTTVKSAIAKYHRYPRFRLFLPGRLRVSRHELLHLRKVVDYNRNVSRVDLWKDSDGDLLIHPVIGWMAFTRKPLFCQPFHAIEPLGRLSVALVYFRCQELVQRLLEPIAKRRQR